MKRNLLFAIAVLCHMLAYAKVTINKESKEYNVYLYYYPDGYFSRDNDI